MEALGTDVAQKIKSAIKAKLKELDAYIDDELPEYILVMVANKKPKSAMIQDLGLFLGNHSPNFTEWLFSVLQKLQSATELKEDISEPPQVEVSRKEGKNSHHIESALEVVNQELGIEPENDRESGGSNDDPDEILAIKAEPEVDDLLSAELLEDQPPTKPITAAPTESPPSYRASKPEQVIKVSPVKPSVTVGGTTRASSASTAPKMISLVHTDKPKQQMEPSAAVAPPISRKSRPALVSTIGKQVKMFEDEEDGYDPCNPSIPSVIRITPRRPSVPPALQAPKSLLMKAVAEATKSVSRRTAANRQKIDLEEIMKQHHEVEPYIPSSQRQLKKNMIVYQDDLSDAAAEQEIRNLQRRLNVRLPNAPKQQSVPEKDVLDLEDDFMLELDYSEPVYTPTPTRNLAQPESPIEEDEQSPAPAAAAPSSTKFIVTLDGINSTRIKRTIDCLDEDEDGNAEKDVEVMMDHENSAVMGQEKEQMEEAVDEVAPPMKKQKVAERCRFWPSCKEGNACVYYHPSIPCKMFPNCIFKDKCKYIHPNCRFDSMCTKHDCPFNHTSKRMAPPAAFKSSAVTKTICRFFPKCTNMNCTFFHPTPCRYGQSCAIKSCLYLHAAVATPDQLKWTAASMKSSTSTRPFALNRVQQYMPVEIVTKQT